MSGSRALEAARRRRAGGAYTAPPPTPPSPPGQTPVSNTMTPSPKMNPTMMLLSHNKILDNLQEVVSNLNDRVESQEKVISDKFDSMNMDDNNIEYYKQKIESMEKHMIEMKKHVLKIQTFAMETNLQFIEMKKQMKQYENVPTQPSEKLMEESENIAEILSEENGELIE